MKRKQLIGIFFVFILAAFAVQDVNAQCAMCKAVAESSSDSVRLAEGLNSGILYLMSLPYIILVALGILLFRKNRQS